MAQVKIYALKTHLAESKQLISEGIHQAVMSAFAYPKEKKFHRMIPLEPDHFIFPEDRSEKYTIIEISMFEGRSISAKKGLITQIYKNLADLAGISAQDIEITLFETPKSNWGIRGLPGDELSLNYKVDV